MTFAPTHIDNTPAVCWCCGFHAQGVGIGAPTAREDNDPKYLCTQCLTIMQQLRHIRRLDPYELEALDGGVDAVAAFLEGKPTDLAEMTELDARMLVKAAWQGCADRLREVVGERGVPF